MKTIDYDPETENHTYLGMKAVKNYGISRIVGRQHVGESFLAVVREVLSCMKGGRKGWLKFPKHERRYAIAASIQHHKENRIQYRQVMACSRVEFVPRYFFDAETKWTHIAPDLIASDLAAMKSA